MSWFFLFFISSTGFSWAMDESDHTLWVEFGLAERGAWSFEIDLNRRINVDWNLVGELSVKKPETGLEDLLLGLGAEKKIFENGVGRAGIRWQLGPNLIRGGGGYLGGLFFLSETTALGGQFDYFHYYKRGNSLFELRQYGGTLELFHQLSRVVSLDLSYGHFLYSGRGERSKELRMSRFRFLNIASHLSGGLPRSIINFGSKFRLNRWFSPGIEFMLSKMEEPQSFFKSLTVALYFKVIEALSFRLSWELAMADARGKDHGIFFGVEWSF